MSILVIVLFVVIFFVGGSLGFVLRFWLVNNSEYDGAVIVTKEDGKTLYSLELHEDPEIIEFKNELVFKVISPGENLTRE